MKTEGRFIDMKQMPEKTVFEDKNFTITTTSKTNISHLNAIYMGESCLLYPLNKQYLEMLICS